MAKKRMGHKTFLTVAAVSALLVGGGAWVLSNNASAAGKPSAAGPKTAMTQAKTSAPPSLGSGPWLNVTARPKPNLATRKGQLTLVHFWPVSGAQPRKPWEEPAALALKYSCRGVETWGVVTPAQDISPAQVRSVLKRQAVEYPVTVDEKGAIRQAWGAGSAPVLFLVDGEGKVRGKWTEPNAATAKVRAREIAGSIEKLLLEGDNKVKTEEDWRKELSPEQYRVLREKGTERAFTGQLWNNHEEGTYICAGCGQELFSSDTKFESGTGWPSFYKPATDKAVGENKDLSHGMVRTEVVCSKCAGHLGHVFNDGPNPTGLRYCINSAALKFKKK